ncbi:MAG: hypothetical protein NZ602_09130 [Thermoguttaceae bacterium]|nr:hypothetical protein [Thermoguttaceae bacterium]
MTNVELRFHGYNFGSSFRVEIQKQKDVPSQVEGMGRLLLPHVVK